MQVALCEKNLYDSNFINTATDQQLNLEFCRYLSENFDDENSILNDDVRDFVLRETVRNSETGRLVMPCVWLSNVIHKISPNYKLAYSILMTNLKKLKKSPLKLKQYDDVIAQQKVVHNRSCERSS